MEVELEAFKDLKVAFSSSTFLIYFNKIRILFINLDTLKK